MLNQLIEAGAISSDTLNPAHLADAFLDTLETIEHTQAAKLRAEWDAIAEDDHDTLDASYVISAMVDALEDAAPDGLYFGTLEGDGACFGFWSAEDDEDADDDAEDVITPTIPMPNDGAILHLAYLNVAARRADASRDARRAYDESMTAVRLACRPTGVEYDVWHAALDSTIMRRAQELTQAADDVAAAGWGV